jgi:hypothetical protein
LREEDLYTALVDPAELWEAVGDILRKRRLRLGWHNPIDVQKHGGPTYHIVTEHEHGRIRTVAKLAQHADTLGLTLVDVLRTALEKASNRISPEAAAILRKFQQTSPEGRQALFLMAKALPPVVGEEPATPGGPPTVPPRSEPHTTE